MLSISLVVQIARVAKEQGYEDEKKFRLVSKKHFSHNRRTGRGVFVAAGRAGGNLLLGHGHGSLGRLNLVG